MTTMRAELGSLPDAAEVASRYRRHCADALGSEIVAGELTDDEHRAIERVERRFRSDDFVHQPGGLRRPGVKIHEDVYVAESVSPTLRVTARLSDVFEERILFCKCLEALVGQRQGMTFMPCFDGICNTLRVASNLYSTPLGLILVGRSADSLQ